MNETEEVLADVCRLLCGVVGQIAGAIARRKLSREAAAEWLERIRRAEVRLSEMVERERRK